MHDLALVGGTVVTDGQASQADVAIDGETIADVAPAGGLGPAREEIDASGLYVLPGAVDAHFHCRAPSHPERGTFASETAAAAAGGVTTVFEMPISNPPCTTPEVLRARRQLAEQECVTDFGLYGGAAVASVSDAEAMADEGAIAFKLFTHNPPPEREVEFQGLWAATEGAIYDAMERVAATGLTCTVHAENQHLIERFRGLEDDAGIPARPPVVESAAIALVGAISAETGTKVHIAHMSSRAAVRALQAARVGNHRMSGETCPHYLIFNETKIKEVDAFVKVAPPLRGADDNGALWSAVADGDVDVVASDHAPFTADEKRVPYHAAPQGIPSVEMMVPVVMDAAARDVLPIERAVQSVTESPARLFGIYPRKGTITAGADADVLLWDPGMVFQVGVESFVSRAGGSGVAYHGLELRGRLRRTILRGATVYRDGQVDTTPRGRYIRPVRED